MTVAGSSTELLARQRRSRFDWSQCVPPEIAAQQIRFERCATVLAMRARGFTLSEVGGFFDLSRERIRQMEWRAKNRSFPPVARYLAAVPEIVRPFKPEKPFRPLHYNAHVLAWRKEQGGGEWDKPVAAGCSTPRQIAEARERDSARWRIANDNRISS